MICEGLKVDNALIAETGLLNQRKAAAPSPISQLLVG